MKAFKFSKDIHLTKIKLSFIWILLQFFFHVVIAILILLKIKKNFKEECWACNKKHCHKIQQKLCRQIWSPLTQVEVWSINSHKQYHYRVTLFIKWINCTYMHKYVCISSLTRVKVSSPHFIAGLEKWVHWTSKMWKPRFQFSEIQNNVCALSTFIG